MIIVGRAIELNRYEQSVLRCKNAAHQHGARVQRLADLPDIGAFSFKPKDGGPRHHVQTGNAPERVDNFFGKTVAEELVFAIAKVHQRKHGDRDIIRRKDAGRRA